MVLTGASSRLEQRQHRRFWKDRVKGRMTVDSVFAQQFVARIVCVGEATLFRPVRAPNLGIRVDFEITFVAQTGSAHQ